MLRDQLLDELKEVNSADAAAMWAHRILPAKNSLNVADARQLENAFRARLAELDGADNADLRPSPFGLMRNQTTLEQKGPEFDQSLHYREGSYLSRVEFAIEST